MDSGPEGTFDRTRVNNAGLPVVLFDGWCPLCVGTVRFILRTDRTGRFRFAALDSSTAEQLLNTCEADPKSLDAARSGASVALVRQGRLHTKSDAALRIAGDLPFPWRGLALLRVVPRFLRDGAYSFAANRRRQMWGGLDSCHVPDPADVDRFL